MRRILVGERNTKHRTALKAAFALLDPSLTVDFAGNGEDILQYLGSHAVSGQVLLIVLDPTLPSIFPGSLMPLLKADERYAQIPIAILAEQAGSNYYAARTSGQAAISVLKPSRQDGWAMLAKRLVDLALENEPARRQNPDEQPTETSDRLIHQVTDQLASPNEQSDDRETHPSPANPSKNVPDDPMPPQPIG